MTRCEQCKVVPGLFEGKASMVVELCDAHDPEPAPHARPVRVLDLIEILLRHPLGNEVTVHHCERGPHGVGRTIASGVPKLDYGADGTAIRFVSAAPADDEAERAGGDGETDHKQPTREQRDNAPGDGMLINCGYCGGTYRTADKMANCPTCNSGREW